MKKMFWLENRTSKPQNGLGFNIYHNIEQNFEIKFCLKVYHQGDGITRGLKMAYENPIPLVVDFQTKFYFKIWFNVMKYVESQVIWRLGSMIFLAKTFFDPLCASYGSTLNFGAFASP